MEVLLSKRRPTALRATSTDTPVPNNTSVGGMGTRESDVNLPFTEPKPNTFPRASRFVKAKFADRCANALRLGGVLGKASSLKTL